jgi:hypothetical protein
MEEIWKDIEGYEGKYQVSNLGNVRSLDYRNTKMIGNLCPKLRSNYLFVHLRNHGIGKCPMVHRLVAKAFIPNPNNYPEVNHKDEDKHNNRADNLEWCTLKYNRNYGTTKIRAIETKNKRNRKNAEKKVLQYDLDGNFIRSYKSSVEVARLLRILSSNVRSACRGLLKTYKGFIWKYAND